MSFACPHPPPFLLPCSPPPRSAPEVRVLDEDKSPLGVMSTSAALAQARAADCDLIMVVPDAVPPVVSRQPRCLLLGTGSSSQLLLGLPCRGGGRHSALRVWRGSPGV
jgi:hypothetical protein